MAELRNAELREPSSILVSSGRRLGKVASQVSQAHMGFGRREPISVRALMVDIDDTILSVRPGATGSSYAPHTGSLMNVLHLAGVELAHLSPEETEQRISRIKREIRWWHWSDFIVALDLDPRAFWEFAYETEHRYMQATGPEIRSALERLRAAGILLFVTSNNPSSGILHKLRLAGLGSIHGCSLFQQLLGGTELNAMKAEPQYWKKVLAHVGLGVEDVAVVGDHLRDDWQIPHSIGIRYAFLLDRTTDRSAENSDGLFYVQSFTEVADRVLGGE